MKPKSLYLSLCILGTALAHALLVPFLSQHGLDWRLFLEQLFANRVSSSFAMDVIVSSVVLWVFVFVDGRRTGKRRLWAPIAANLAVGVSLGLPLFLYMRERQLKASP